MMKKILSNFLTNIWTALKQDKWFWIAFGLIFIYAVLIRFIGLEGKTLHHDESIHAYFSWFLYKDGSYQYHPLTHGPLLYYLIVLSFKIFGVSDAASHVPPALFGALIIPILLFLRKFLSKKTVLVVMLLVATSPMLTYVSRFARHDMISIFFTLGIVLSTIGYLTKPKPIYVYVWVLSLAFSFANHELTYLTMAIWGASMIATLAVSTQRQQLWKIFIQRDLWHLLLGLSIASSICILFYSSFGTFPQGIKRMLPNPFDKESTIGYWIAQQGVRRAAQPFHFYIMEMLVYDILPFALAVFGMFWGLRKVRFGYLYAVLIIGILAALYPSLDITGTYLHTTKSVFAPLIKHIPLLLLVILFVAFGIGYKNTPRRFITIYAGLTLLAYSIASEKMPWLSTHSLIMMILVAGFTIDAVWDRLHRFAKWPLLLIFVAAIGMSVFNSYRLCFINPDNRIEYAVYVQSQPIVKQLAKQFEASGPDFKMTYGPDLAWPMSWYLRNVPNDLVKIVSETTLNPISLMSMDEYNSNGWALAQYQQQTRYPFRAWWVPSTGWPGLKPLLNYYFKREVWNPSGLGSYDMMMLENPRIKK